MNIDTAAIASTNEIAMLTDEYFQSVSFQKGNKPAYQNLYHLFISCGLLIRNSGPMPEIMTVSQFIEPRQRLVDSGELAYFRETETAAITEVFGNIAHRFSTYEKHGINANGEFSGFGMVSTQFVMTETGWKISVMAWDDERPGLTIPEHYR